MGSSNDEESLIQIAPVPRISIQAFCETQELCAAISDSASDRRMDKAQIKVQMGGAPAAIEAFRGAPTPNMIVLEALHDRAQLRHMLEELSQFCDPGTRVVVIGKMNDIALYRELMDLGVSDYLIAPLSVLDFVRAVSALYATEGAPQLGRCIAFIGAKGGVGASSIAHNVAWSIATEQNTQTVIVDLDLAFGTAGLDFNQDPIQGIADAVYAPDRVDATMLDRLFSKCSSHLNLLAAPASLERTFDFEETAFDIVMDVLRSSVPAIVLDVPHLWTAWSRRVLTGADEIVIVANPDLANLRNVKSLIDTLKGMRPNDAPPRFILNGVGMMKRPEIDAKDFAQAVGVQPAALIPYDAKLFGTATNNGQMLSEVEASNKIYEMISDIGNAVMGRVEIRRPKKTILAPLMERLAKRKPS